MDARQKLSAEAAIERDRLEVLEYTVAEAIRILKTPGVLDERIDELRRLLLPLEPQDYRENPMDAMKR